MLCFQTHMLDNKLVTLQPHISHFLLNKASKTNHTHTLSLSPLYLSISLCIYVYINMSYVRCLYLSTSVYLSISLSLYLSLSLPLTLSRSLPLPVGAVFLGLLKAKGSRRAQVLQA